MKYGTTRGEEYLNFVHVANPHGSRGYLICGLKLIRGHCRGGFQPHGLSLGRVVYCI